MLMRIRERPSQSSPCGRSTLVNPRSSSCAPRGARTSADPSTLCSCANAPSGFFAGQASRRLAATTKSASTACGDTRCGGSSRRAMKKPRWPASRDKRTSKTYSSIRCEAVSGHAALLARQPDVRSLRRNDPWAVPSTTDVCPQVGERRGVALGMPLIGASHSNPADGPRCGPAALRQELP